MIFKKSQGAACLINTSFNVRGEPIVCTPTRAYLCFIQTEMDIWFGKLFAGQKNQEKPGREKKLIYWQIDLSPSRFHKHMRVYEFFFLRSRSRLLCCWRVLVTAKDTKNARLRKEILA